MADIITNRINSLFVNTGGSVNNWYGPLAQTFTATSSGYITDLTMYLSSGSTGNNGITDALLYVTIATTDSGAPTYNYLWQTSIDPATLPNVSNYPQPDQYYDVSLNGESIPVVGGQQYAIEVWRLVYDGGSVGWYGNWPGSYSGGEAYFNSYYINDGHTDAVYTTPFEYFQQYGSWNSFSQAYPNMGGTLQLGFSVTIGSNDTQVSEPETYALILTARGLLVVISRRKKQN